MKRIEEWGIAEWTIIALSTLIADRVLQHIAYYVGYGAAVIQTAMSS